MTHRSLATVLALTTCLCLSCNRTPECGPKDPGKCKLPIPKCVESGSWVQCYVADWPQANRALLESIPRGGTVVAAQYWNQDLHILPGCSAPGQYQYAPVTLSSERVVIRNEQELRAFFPLQIATLQGSLREAGQLDVTLATVGQFNAAPSARLSGGDCGKATHYVKVVTVGAFDVAADAERSRSVGAQVTHVGIGAGYKGTTTGQALIQNGDRGACGAQPSPSGPPYGCGAVVHLTLVPVSQMSVGRSDVVNGLTPDAGASDQCNCAAPSNLFCAAVCAGMDFFR